MKIENILVPTDFSESASCALPHALELAKQFDSRLTALHARVLFEDNPNRPDFSEFAEGRYAEYVESELARIRHSLGKECKVKTATVRSISAAAGILNYVERNPMDAVVMGTHGRSGLGRFLLGSVAEKVVRHSCCPALTVAPHLSNYRDNPTYSKILAAFDYSEYSVQAVRIARELAVRYGAALYVLYVHAQQVHPNCYELWKLNIIADLPELSANLRGALSKNLGEEALEGLEVHVECGRGDGRASETIVKSAQENLVDLMVMGTHGLTGIERVLLGSTTERVVRTARCPVLTVHRCTA
jgi:nucleotide-binding universal stress UspA family protein